MKIPGFKIDRLIAEGGMASVYLGIQESLGRRVALKVLNRQGIVHRDIKPGNILFHADGTPKLTDFGIAKQLDDDQDLTMDGSAFGSPYYISPEQAEAHLLDGRSDIYGIGIVFHNWLRHLMANSLRTSTPALRIAFGVSLVSIIAAMVLPQENTVQQNAAFEDALATRPGTARETKSTQPPAKVIELDPAHEEARAGIVKNFKSMWGSLFN